MFEEIMAKNAPKLMKTLPTEQGSSTPRKINTKKTSPSQLLKTQEAIVKAGRKGHITKEQLMANFSSTVKAK